MEITPQSWGCGQIYNSFSIETLRVTKTGNARLSKIYSYPGVPALLENVWFRRNFTDLGWNRQGSRQKFNDNIIEKLRIRQGEILFPCHIQGVSPKISFLLCSIHDSPFSWTPCPRVLKFGDLGEENMLIPNIQVHYLSEQPLTMNLERLINRSWLIMEGHVAW